MDFSLTYDITQIPYLFPFSTLISIPHSANFKPYCLSQTDHLICMPLNLISSSLTLLFACVIRRGVTLLFMSSLNFLLFPLLYRKLLKHKRLKIKIYYSSSFCPLLGLSWIALSCNFSYMSTNSEVIWRLNLGGWQKWLLHTHVWNLSWDGWAGQGISLSPCDLSVSLVSSKHVLTGYLVILLLSEQVFWEALWVMTSFLWPMFVRSDEVIQSQLCLILLLDTRGRNFLRVYMETSY